MKKSRASTASRLFTARAPLAALGLKRRSLKLFETISQHVSIKQKTIKHTPLEKLTDAFIAILSGAHGLAEINTRVRTDTALQRAFGRESCAEQSVVQETLSACTAENVAHNVTLSSCYQGDPRDTNTCLSDTSRAGSVELLPQPDSRTDGAYDTEFAHVTGNINHAGLPPITGLPHP